MTPSLGRCAFTLIELLVVITIIVVLLALLTPALDRAIYQAELAVCAATQDTISGGSLMYAAANRRRYPQRLQNDSQEPSRLYDGTGDPTHDDRVTLDGYVGTASFQDPLDETVDRSLGVTHDDSSVFANFSLWYGFQYTPDEKTERGMFKIGDRFSWTEKETNRILRFNLLSSDEDQINNESLTIGSHPDADGVMYSLVYDNETLNEKLTGTDTGGTAVFGAGKFVFSRWENGDTAQRGPIDENFAFDDGSVSRINNVLWDEDKDFESRRVVRAPKWNTGPDVVSGTFLGDSWVRIPEAK